MAPLLKKPTGFGILLVNNSTMKASMFIAPRQSGKTTQLINTVGRDRRKIAVIADSEAAAMCLRKWYHRLGFCDANVMFMGARTAKQKLIGHRVEVIYCDEWLFFRPCDQASIVETAHAMDTELRMYSSPKFTYQKAELDVVRSLLEHHNNAREFVDKLGNEDKYEALLPSLICHPKVEITHYTAKLPKERYEYLIKAFNYNKEAADREFCAIYEIE